VLLLVNLGVEFEVRAIALMPVVVLSEVASLTNVESLIKQLVVPIIRSMGTTLLGLGVVRTGDHSLKMNKLQSELIVRIQARLASALVAHLLKRQKLLFKVHSSFALLLYVDQKFSPVIVHLLDLWWDILHFRDFPSLPKCKTAVAKARHSTHTVSTSYGSSER
jgi:hypothetical protein